MILQEIEFEGFRNLLDRRISFCGGLNIITGENGAGKTNLLEAIFFSAYGSSFRTNDDKNMVKFNNPYMKVTGVSNGVNASIFYNGTKKFIINGNEKERLSDYAGWLPVVVMSLNDIWIIRGAPAKRRNFLDWLLIKSHPVYGANLSEYKKILRQRNLLLKQENLDISLLDVYNEQFIQWANLIYAERKKILPVFKKMLELKGKEIGLGELSFEYISSCPDMELTFNDLKKMESLEFNRAETLLGPHRDDFTIQINGYPAKQFSSEGESRIIALLLKLIEGEIIRQKINQEPIFLLDEVTIELDRIHRKKFFGMIKGQIFYATVDGLDDINIQDKKKFIIKRGTVAVS
uniref:DNA replication and repair protein RecF n=1 Tax=candidate division WOR-3 bacterium TaxID=2052148 RepID=A0A7V0Z7Z1_UNCW3